MAVIENWTLKGPGGLTSEWKYNDSVSNKVGNRVIMRTSAHERIHQRMSLMYWDGTNGNPLYALTAANSNQSPLYYAQINHNAQMSKMNNHVSARFDKRVRTGAASLGVTLASWRQSQEMMSSRLNRVSRSAELRYKYLTSHPRALKGLRLDIKRDLANGRQPLANQVLELEFGWMPLFQDLDKAKDLLSQPLPSFFTRATVVRDAKWLYRDVNKDRTVQTQGFGRFRNTISAEVLVTNPNSYLANTAGLSNGLQVAWDLIPWSFVVGAFVNVNQMIGSLTNEVGLTVRNRALTITTRGQTRRDVSYPWFKHTGIYIGFASYKKRTRITANPVTWQVRPPRFDWETAAIAASLVTQKVKRLNRLLLL